MSSEGIVLVTGGAGYIGSHGLQSAGPLQAACPCSDVVKAREILGWKPNIAQLDDIVRRPGLAPAATLTTHRTSFLIYQRLGKQVAAGRRLYHSLKAATRKVIRQTIRVSDKDAIGRAASDRNRLKAVLPIRS